MEPCSCLKDINAKLTERFKENTPQAVDHKVELQGYGFAIVDNVLTLTPYMSFEAGATYPMKNGGTKWKTTKGTMVFSFCPFCGVKIAKEAK